MFIRMTTLCTNFKVDNRDCRADVCVFKRVVGQHHVREVWRRGRGAGHRLTYHLQCFHLLLDILAENRWNIDKNEKKTEYL